jgi:Spy/CpxP family protein refolding chaperone
MRKTLLTMALVALLAVPVLAQRFGGGFGMFGGAQGGDRLLMNKSVQDELKLDDKQKKQLEEISKSAREEGRKAFEAMKDGDKEKAMEIFKKVGEEQTKSLKKFKDGLTSTQTKRFGQIEVQVAKQRNEVNIFKREDIQKALKLTDKQKESVKETLSDLEKDVKEVMEDAKGGGKEKRGELFKKLQTMRKDAFEKVTKAFSEDQNKAWNELSGEKFEYKEDKGRFGGFGGKGKRGGKKDGDKKKDDF